MKNYGKNKKKQFKKSLKGIEREISSKHAKKRISDVKFDIALEQKKRKIKKNNKNSAKPFSTKEAVTETFIDDKIGEFSQPQVEFTDIWSNDLRQPKSKKRVIRKIETKEIPIEGQSYNPSVSGQKALLGYLVNEEMKKEKDIQRVKRFFEPLKTAQKTVSPVDLAIEFLKNQNDPNYVQEEIYPDHELDHVVTKVKAPKQKNPSKIRRIELENIPKILKQIKREKKEKVVKTEKSKAIREKIDETKRVVKEVEKLPFSLPEEVPSCLRRLNPSTTQLASSIQSRKDQIPLKRTGKIYQHARKTKGVNRRNRKKYITSLQPVGKTKNE